MLAAFTFSKLAETDVFCVCQVTEKALHVRLLHPYLHREDRQEAAVQEEAETRSEKMWTSCVKLDRGHLSKCGNSFVSSK